MDKEIIKQLDFFDLKEVLQEEENLKSEIDNFCHSLELIAAMDICLSNKNFEGCKMIYEMMVSSNVTL